MQQGPSYYLSRKLEKRAQGAIGGTGLKLGEKCLLFRPNKTVWSKTRSSWWHFLTASYVGRPNHYFFVQTGKETEYESLYLGSIVKNDGSRDVITATLELVQRTISNQVTLHYGRSLSGYLYFMFPSRHFRIEVGAPKELFITPMVVKGRPLDYKYKLEFHEILHRETFLKSAGKHQFVGNAPDREPQDTGNSDVSITSDGRDFYDEKELKFFHTTEAEMNGR